MTSKPSYRVSLAEELLEQIRTKTKRERRAIGEAMNRVLEAWGQPHVHAGVGIRRLTKTIYECRVGLDDRLAFVVLVTPQELVFFFLGNHDEIQKLIRGKK
ncbi:hypothetical protein [Luteolibacter sp. Populi]|uniref:hypothetical protein n=1 Tax=Luteolibacter sp. Populi TaxID=3230487 RepID=UPI003467B9DC